MNFKEYLNSKNSSDYINAEFRTDAEGIKQLQAKQDTLNAKLKPIYSQIKELESKRDIIMFKMAGISTNLIEFGSKGQKATEMEAKFKKLGDESDKITKDLEKLYPKHDELSAEIDRIQKTLSKLVVRNAKKLGIDILDYVFKNKLHK